MHGGPLPGSAGAGARYHAYRRAAEGTSESGELAQLRRVTSWINDPIRIPPGVA